MHNVDHKGIISFAYQYNDMFDSVCALSAYMVKNASNEAGALLDAFALTEDERPIYEACLKKAVLDIYDALSKISYKGEGAYHVFYSDPENDPENPSTVFKIINNAAYNVNFLQLVDDTIADCLRYGILSEFYAIITNPVLQKNSQEMYARNMQLLDRRLFQLKKKRISSLL